MVEFENSGFDTTAFLAHAGLGRRVIQLAPKDAFFSQGDPADSVFYLQKGSAKVTVDSPTWKEATIALLTAGDFVGEEALSRRCRGYVWPQPLPLPPAPLSGSAAER